MEGGSQIIVTLALVGAALALAAAVVCIGVTAWFVRRERAGADVRPRVAQRAASQAPIIHVLQPPPQQVVLQQLPPPPVVQVGWVPPVAAPPVAAPSAPSASAFQLQRPWPGVAEALGRHLRVETDPVERMRVAIDLGGLGGATSARLLLDAVRDGSISPAAGAQAISRTGFDGGIVAGLALNEADPRVRTMAQLVADGATVNASTTQVPS